MYYWFFTPEVAACTAKKLREKKEKHITKKQKEWNFIKVSSESHYLTNLSFAHHWTERPCPEMYSASTIEKAAEIRLNFRGHRCYKWKSRGLIMQLDMYFEDL